MGIEDRNRHDGGPTLRLGRVPAPQMPQLEALWNEHAVSNPAFLSAYQRLKVMLDGDAVDAEAFQQEMIQWNESQGEGPWGDVVKKDPLKQGRLKVYCDSGSGKLRFGFKLNQ